MLLPADDRSLTPDLALDGEYDPWLGGFFRRVLRPGDHVVDVGANIGLFTMLAVRLVRPGGTVRAYEVDALNVEFLEANIGMNYADGIVDVRPIAAWSGPARLSLHRKDFYRGDSSLTEVMDGDDCPVLAEAISSTWDSSRKMRLCKIDVEGGEFQVFQGLSELMRLGAVDYVVFEALPGLLGENVSGLSGLLSEQVETGAKLFVPIPKSRLGRCRQITPKQLFAGQGYSQAVLAFRPI